MKTMDISGLCEDELMHIFSFLNIRELIIDISVVSKEFFESVYVLIQNLKLSDYFSNLFDDRHVVFLTNSVKELKHLNLSSCSDITEKCFASLELKKETLTSLNLGYCRSFNSDQLAHLIETCSLLEVVKLDHLFIDDEVMKSISTLKNLKELTCYRSSITDQGLTLVANSCPNLEILDVGMSSITSKSLIEISRHCKNLRDVTIDCNSKLKVEELVQFIKPCSKLVSLSMKETVISSKFLIILLDSCPLLNNLEIKYCTTKEKSDIKRMTDDILKNRKIKLWL